MQSTIDVGRAVKELYHGDYVSYADGDIGRNLFQFQRMEGRMTYFSTCSQPRKQGMHLSNMLMSRICSELT